MGRFVGWFHSRPAMSVDDEGFEKLAMTAQFQLLPDAVGTVQAATKADVIARLAARFAEVYKLDAQMVLERIEERERLGSTGLAAVWPFHMPVCRIWPGRLRYFCG